MVLVLHQSGASHGHSHGVPVLQRGKRTWGYHHGSASVTAAFVHVLGDLLQSVGVFLAATVIHFWVSFMRPEISALGTFHSELHVY